MACFTVKLGRWAQVICGEAPINRWFIVRFEKVIRNNLHEMSAGFSLARFKRTLSRGRIFALCGRCVDRKLLRRVRNRSKTGEDPSRSSKVIGFCFEPRSNWPNDSTPALICSFRAFFCSSQALSCSQIVTATRVLWLMRKIWWAYVRKEWVAQSITYLINDVLEISLILIYLAQWMMHLFVRPGTHIRENTFLLNIVKCVLDEMHFWKIPIFAELSILC